MRWLRRRLARAWKRWKTVPPSAFWPQLFPVGNEPQSVAASGYDRDGKPDLVMAEFDSLGVLLQV